MRLSRETRLTYLAMLACVVMRMAIALLFTQWRLAGDSAVFECRAVFDFACYAVFLMAWLRLLARRSIDRETSACLAAAGVLLLLLSLLTTIKHEYAVGETLSRYLWYGYYAPTTLVPALLFLAVLHIGKRAGEPIDRRWLLLPLGSLALLLLVATNDLHMLVFRFPGGPGSDPAVWREDDAVRGPLALLPWAWLMLLAVAGIVVALARCLRHGGGRRWWVLLVPLALGLLYIALFYRVDFGTMLKFNDAMVILCVVFMECLVRLGLFPVNEGYGELWEASSLRGALMADDGTVAYAAARAPQVTPAQVRRALALPQRLQDDDELLVARAVTGGTAYWVRNLARMHLLKAQLDEQGDVLAEERTMLAATNELARERAAVAQRQRLYDELTVRVAPHLARLDELLRELPADEEGFVATMRRAAVEATYVKRCAYLTLTGEGGSVDARDLALALAEAQDALARAGARVVPAWQGAGQVDVSEALAVFDAYHELGERALAGTAEQGRIPLPTALPPRTAGGGAP